MPLVLCKICCTICCTKSCTILNSNCNVVLFLSKSDTLDVMHVKKNILANMPKHLFEDKDVVIVRRNMQATDAFYYIWLFYHVYLQLVSRSTSWIRVWAPLVFVDHKKHKFMVLVSKTKTPTNFNVILWKHIEEKQLSGLNKHNHHILIQYILPIAIWNNLVNGRGDAIIQFW